MTVYTFTHVYIMLLKNTDNYLHISSLNLHVTRFALFVMTFNTAINTQSHVILFKSVSLFPAESIRSNIATIHIK